MLQRCSSPRSRSTRCWACRSAPRSLAPWHSRALRWLCTTARYDVAALEMCVRAARSAQDAVECAPAKAATRERKWKWE